MTLGAAVTPGAAALADAKRVVIKIGSALLVDASRGVLRRDWLKSVVADASALAGAGAQVLIVSSGAIGLGRAELDLGARALRLDESQAAAAAGQIKLAHAYHAAFAPHRLRVAQILLTLEDTEKRSRYLNARRTLTRLLALGVVPVVNENDTVATDEIRYGDNDCLAGRVAQMIGADCLVLLSDIDGLYSADPATEPGARFIASVADIDARIEAMAGGSRSALGKGGMQTKLAAARIATAAGCHVVLADGRVANPMAAVRDGARHTHFVPRGTPASARKQWIAGTLRPRGALRVDAGAATALAAGKSLLAAGVKAVEGQFERGDPVRVVGEDGELIALGLSAYDSGECARLPGCKSGDIEAVLGYRGRAEMIHRDDLVLTDKS